MSQLKKAEAKNFSVTKRLGVSSVIDLGFRLKGCAAFQDQQAEIKNVFALHHYKALGKFLTLTGLNPYCATRGSKIRFNVVLYSVISSIIPLVLELCVAIQAKDIDEIIDILPHIFVVLMSLIQFGNIFLNKERFKILLDSILKDWETLTNELQVLDKVTAEGSRLAYLYRMTLLSFLVVFNYIPLIPPTLDIILPLNETRPRQQLYQVNYIFFDVDDHFFAIYLHMAWAGSLTVFIIVTIDSLYMLIIHHASGLFDVCGYQVQMTCKNGEFRDGAFNRCAMTHHKALGFFDLLQECSQNMNFMLVGMSMVLISMTAVQIILYKDQPMDALRYVLFLIAEKFHLFVISLNGQILLNHALLLTVNIFNASWYNVPIKHRKLLYTMIVRSNKACILSAAGLYDMNIENFGKTVKACMSYFTMFLSLRG